MVLRDVLRSIVLAVVDADERLPEGEFISLDYSEGWAWLYHFKDNEDPQTMKDHLLELVSDTYANCENEERVAELMEWLKAKGEKHE